MSYRLKCSSMIVDRWSSSIPLKISSIYPLTLIVKPRSDLYLPCIPTRIGLDKRCRYSIKMFSIQCELSITNKFHSISPRISMRCLEILWHYKLMHFELFDTQSFSYAFERCVNTLHWGIYCKLRKSRTWKNILYGNNNRTLLGDKLI